MPLRTFHGPALLLALLATTPLASATPLLTDVDAVIERHIEARGGHEAIEALDDLIFSRGLYTEPGYSSDGDAVMMLKRPYYKLVGHPEKEPAYMEGYDGAAWEYFAEPGLVVRTVGKPSAAIRHYADVEGPLLDYRAKGHDVVLGEPAEIAGRPAYRLVITMMDGYATEWILDAETFLLIASRHHAAVHAFGEEVASETRIGDHREVAGVLFPHRFEETRIADGKLLNRMQWRQIEANTDIPDAWFSPPAFERTPLQRFMEHLFVQRSDVDAMLWTYHRFRRAHPGIDTREAVELVGFQVLKMGDHDQAVALLARNAADHPRSASSAFGLGRAYVTAGDAEQGRHWLERALALDPDHARARRMLAELAG